MQLTVRGLGEGRGVAVPSGYGQLGRLGWAFWPLFPGILVCQGFLFFAVIDWGKKEGTWG